MIKEINTPSLTSKAKLGWKGLEFHCEIQRVYLETDKLSVFEKERKDKRYNTYEAEEYHLGLSVLLGSEYVLFFDPCLGQGFFIAYEEFPCKKMIKHQYF